MRKLAGLYQVALCIGPDLFPGQNRNVIFGHYGALKRKWRPPTGRSAHRSRKKFKKLLAYDFLRPKPIPQANCGIRKRSPNDPERQGGPVDNSAGSHRTGLPLDGETKFEPSRIFFRYCLHVFHGTNEAGRFSIEKTGRSAEPINGIYGITRIIFKHFHGKWNT